MNKRMIALTAALALSLTLAGCAKDAEPTIPTTTNTEFTPTATAAPDEPLSPLIGDVILSGEEVRQIREDYWEWDAQTYPDEWPLSLDEIDIYEYIGTFGDAVVLILDAGGGFEDVLTKQEVAGYKMFFPNSAPVDVYKNGDFKEMHDAYQAGWIDESVLEKMAAYFHEWEE